MDFKLDESGDLLLEGGTTVSLCDREEDLVKQRINTTLKTNKGEWDYDLDLGIPWLENPNNNFSILGKTPITIFNSEIKKAILKREGVLSIKSYETKYNNAERKIEVKVVVETINGEILTVRI